MNDTPLPAPAPTDDAAPTASGNTLYYGDNLDVLRRYIADESVDLIYADPPFNSARNYNVLFRDDGSGIESSAQIQAFKDTWTWARDERGYSEAEESYNLLMVGSADGRIRPAPVQVQRVLQALIDMLPDKSAMSAYLVMMATRLVECHRALKPTGTMYLHCDPTASHYLKMLMDAVFGAESFRNEIIWERTKAKGLATRNLPTNHDTIFRYTKGKRWTWNPIYTPHDVTDERVLKFYKHVEPGTNRRYQLTDLTNPNPKRPNLTYEFLGVTRVWRWTRQRMQEAYDKGLVIQSKPGAVPRLKRYLDEQEGVSMGDVWTDISPVQPHSNERLGYPTQKPIALLERIVRMSSNPGDVVLDPFCGCGTTIVAAQRLGRGWVGIDITHLSTALLKMRLDDIFELRAGRDYDLVGEPKDVAGARALAQQDRYQFEFWALSLVRARPKEGQEDKETGARSGKRGRDRGIDGVITFMDSSTRGRSLLAPQRILVQVKSGIVSVGDVRELRAVVEREKAAMGVFITLEDATRDMNKEVTGAGFYESALQQERYPRLQILTIAQLLDGARIKMPPHHSTFKAAERDHGPTAQNRPLNMPERPPDDDDPQA